MTLTLEFSEDRRDDLSRLEKDTQASLKDLVNNALTILEWAVEEIKKGNEVATINERDSQYNVLLNPLLQRVAALRSARNEKAA
jgi:hypothetical protein